VQIEWNKIKSVIVEAAKESLGEKKGKRNEEWFDRKCRTAIQERNNMRKIMLQRRTSRSKEDLSGSRGVGRAGPRHHVAEG
jgi:hypothetical protein